MGDNGGAFQSFSKQGKRHERAAAKKAAALRKLTNIPGPVGVAGVMRHAIRDHFRQTCADNSFYSVDSSAAPSFETMDHFMDSNAVEVAAGAKRKRQTDALDAIEDVVPDLDGRPRTSFSFGQHPTHP